MSVNHEAVSALPVGGPADAALIRAMCERRFAYSLSASEVSTNLQAGDIATGVVPLYLIQNSTLFAYDSTDSTTTHDGVTCLVSADGKRFKSGTISPPYSVLTRGTAAQPASPSVGDRYLIPTAATGTDWSGQDGKIGIYTAAGWRFAVSPIGRFLYIEDQTAFYHRNAAGTWTAGVGSITLGAGSVTLANVLGANASFVIKVENQTTNAPPASPVTPTAYIIGPSPTGAWAGNAGKLAICLVAGAFTIITPVAGDTVYDKALSNSFRFAGGAWVSSTGVVLGTKSARTNASTQAYGSIPVDGTIPQITEGTLMLSFGPYTPVSTASVFRVRFNTTLNNPSGGSSNVAALFLNSNSNAVCAAVVTVTTATNAHTLEFTHEFATGNLTPFSLSVRMGADAGLGVINPNYVGGVIATVLTLDEVIFS